MELDVSCVPRMARVERRARGGRTIEDETVCRQCSKTGFATRFPWQNGAMTERQGRNLLPNHFAFRSMSIRLIHALQTVVPLGIAT